MHTFYLVLFQNRFHFFDIVSLPVVNLEISDSNYESVLLVGDFNTEMSEIVIYIFLYQYDHKNLKIL